jgi:GNAT superfamily N-acetyltransferase
MPPPSLLDQLRTWLGQGPRVAGRWGEVHRALEAVHPSSPHWYLSLLGVDPNRQGIGVGSALLDAWLASVDCEAAASYLETDREENLGLYRGVGFAVQQRIEVLGTPVWCMWRPPSRNERGDAGLETRDSLEPIDSLETRDRRWM